MVDLLIRGSESQPFAVGHGDEILVLGRSPRTPWALALDLACRGGQGDLPVVTLPLRRAQTGMTQRDVFSMRPRRAQILEPNCPAPAAGSDRHTST